MRSTKKVALVKGRRLRVTRTDACGRPVYGDDAQVTSKGFISVAYTANTNDSDAILVTNAAGEILINEAGFTSITGYGVVISFGEVDPELFSLVTGQPLVLDASGNPVGLDIDTKISLQDSGFALEVWAGAPSTDACSDDEAQGTYGYILNPFLQGGILGDFTVENGGISFTITGANTKDGNAWGRGPYDVMLNLDPDDPEVKIPGPMVDPVSSTVALRMLLVDVAPPEPTTGSRPLLDPTVPALTTLTATGATGSLAVEFSVAPYTTGKGIWYDFGDDTWDYVLGDIDHTYSKPGTYTASASSNGTWVSTTVVVPGV